jgi:UDP-N-acetylmuramoylalanine--D-glutamate ligase
MIREDIQREWQGKRVAVIGLGVSNVPLIHFLRKYGVVISGRDRKTKEQLGSNYSVLRDLQIELRLGKDYLEDLEGYDAVFLSPGVPRHLPQIRDLRRKTPILSEIALVLRYCPAPIYGITGSSGKTTTTTLIGEMLRHSGLTTYVGGNIGRSLIEEIETISPEGKVVLELSSFQLEDLDTSPHGALVTNITENHLDIHLTMENYINAKRNIYLHQGSGDFAVFNADDPITMEMASQGQGQVYLFSMKNSVERGAYLQGDELIYRDEDGAYSFVKRSEVALLGEHNIQNLLAAAIVSHLAGASWTAVSEVAQNFTGVPHRLELVLQHEGVSYYNDSIATSPARAIAGLRSFSQPIILIAGGYDKKLSFRELGKEIHQRTKAVIVLGDTASLITDAVEAYGSFPIHQVQDLEGAVELGAYLAEAGDVVLFSPACASYDMYPNFEVRGEHFRALVHKLVLNK